MKKYVYLFCASVLLVCACSEGNPSTSSSENAATAAKNDTTSVGGDRDEHGCIPSAGYVWSAVHGKCIRTFESGVKLLPAEMPTDGSAVFAAYAVFSEDSLRAELFLPERGGIVLDRRTLPSGGYAWNIEDDDTYNLRRDVSGEWIAEKRGNVLYRQAMEK